MLNQLTTNMLFIWKAANTVNCSQTNIRLWSLSKEYTLNQKTDQKEKAKINILSDILWISLLKCQIKICHLNFPYIYLMKSD